MRQDNRENERKRLSRSTCVCVHVRLFIWDFSL